MIETAQVALAQGDAWALECERALLEHLAAYGSLDGAGFGTVVRTEYAELFVGPRPPLAPLYESLYAGFPRRLCTETTRLVRRAYEESGLEVRKRNHVPDDHLGYELEFLACLCEDEARAVEQGDHEGERASIAAQHAFLSEHLTTWIELFCARVEAASCSDFYRAWARFAASFVLIDGGFAFGRVGLAS